MLSGYVIEVNSHLVKKMITKYDSFVKLRKEKKIGNIVDKMVFQNRDSFHEIFHSFLNCIFTLAILVFILYRKEIEMKIIIEILGGIWLYFPIFFIIQINFLKFLFTLKKENFENIVTGLPTSFSDLFLTLIYCGNILFLKYVF